ncbi:MAG: chromosome partitioning protein ParB [Tannerella sp.]|jgi:hypothetical protein|nr:chromosome partitioning protein ParB [Tannerella sp.]
MRDITSKDLFGNETTVKIPAVKRRTKSIYDDYEGFERKFKKERKKTTNDCYTPPEIYNCVVNYVAGKVDLSGREIIRPFWPDGDYENAVYPDGCVVIDNPPFSIITKICRFYIERDIGFFLFAPHLTLFSVDADCTAVVCAANITYENGAGVKTSFLSNLFGDIRVIGCPVLLRKLNEVSAKSPQAEYRYPREVLTASRVAAIVNKGVGIALKKSDLFHVRGLDAQKSRKTSIFGAGFFLSQAAAEATEAAEIAAAEAKEAIVWRLSYREKEIIKLLK